MLARQKVLMVLLGATSSVAYITRKSKFDASSQFTIPWVCRDPTSSENKSMALLNPSFGVSSTYDPIGVSGGCMPDATCVNGVSQWTNVFRSKSLSQTLLGFNTDSFLEDQLQRLFGFFIRFPMCFLRPRKTRYS